VSEALNSSLKSAAKGAAFVLAGMAISQGLWFGIRLLVVRNLSKEDLGIYSLAIGIVSLVSLLASVGLWEGSTRYISIFSGQGKKKDADAVHQSSLIIAGITGIGTGVLIFLLSGFISNHLFYKPELSVPLKVLSFFIPLFVMSYIIAAVLRGYGDIRPRVYFLDIGQPFFFLILLSLILIFSMPFINIIYAYVLSIGGVCMLIANYAYRQTGIGFFELKRGGYIRELLKFSLPVFAIDFMSLVFKWADTLVLGRYVSAEEVGVYSVSVSLAVFLSLPLLALDSIYMPIAGEMYGKNRPSELSRTYKVLTKWIFSVTLPIFFILFFFPEMTITFLFGERFSDAATPLRILSFGYLVNAFFGVNAMLLLVIGHSGTLLKVFAAGTVLNLLLNYILIKHAGLGMLGAAVASMSSISVISISGSFVLYRISGMHPITGGYLKPVLASSLIGMIIYAAAKSFPLYFWVLPIYFLLYICGYIVSLIFTRSLDAEDFFLLELLLTKAGINAERINKVLRIISLRKSGQG
jgi:O-antigen/teichoic acid export membrane protein